MGDKTFFPGERTVESFLVVFHEGKATLRCTVDERWEEEIGGTLRCGTEHTYSVSRRFGISTTDREELETSIAGSLGLKGIAELKSEVKGKVGRELRLDEGQEIKKEFKLKAPECGRLSLCVYKLIRLYRFWYEHERFWRRETWSMTIVEGTNHIDDRSTRETYDPACGCEPQEQEDTDEKLKLVFNNVSLLVDCVHTKKGIEIPTTRMIIPANRIEDIMFVDFTFESKALPPYLLFLAGISGQVLTGQFRPAEEYGAHRAEFTRKQSRETPSVDRAQEERARPLDAPERLGALLIGAGLGATLALLFAPRAGSELRDDLAIYARAGLDAAGEHARAARRRTSDAYHTAWERASDVYGALVENMAVASEAVSEAAGTQTEQIAAAIEAGKQAYREERKKTGEQVAKDAVE